MVSQLLLDFIRNMTVDGEKLGTLKRKPICSDRLIKNITMVSA